MQHPEYQLELAAEAEHDFEDILLYTLLTWGPAADAGLQ